MIKEQCQDCRFWRLILINDVENPEEWEPVDLSGQCRRFPPVITHHTRTIQWTRVDEGRPIGELQEREVSIYDTPITDGEYWCGEFKIDSEMSAEHTEWTTELPKRPGWYWVWWRLREEQETIKSCVRVSGADTAGAPLSRDEYEVWLPGAESPAKLSEMPAMFDSLRWLRAGDPPLEPWVTD